MKKTVKKLLAVLLAVAMGAAFLGLTACGGSNDAGAQALTKEEYEQAVEDLGTQFSEIQTNATEAMSDPAAAKDVLASMKQPLEDFIAITPPEIYAAGHEKLQSGCDAMLDFIGTVEQMVDETDQAKLSELTTQMTEQMQTAMNDMLEGATLLDEAAAG